MATDTAQKRATLEDLYREEGPAELVGGRIIRDMTGERPGEVATNIVVGLHRYAKKVKHGKALGDGIGYVAKVDASDRESFCPDASYHTKPPAANPMKFIVGAPDFAAEVRSEGDYGPASERRLAQKRTDYFEAGTLVVWDVDPIKEEIRSYQRDDPDNPRVFRKGKIADAEPAVPGWRIATKDVFA
jgi:Uma2 family endonuclease